MKVLFDNGEYDVLDTVIINGYKLYVIKYENEYCFLHEVFIYIKKGNCIITYDGHNRIVAGFEKYAISAYVTPSGYYVENMLSILDSQGYYAITHLLIDKTFAKKIIRYSRIKDILK